MSSQLYDDGKTPAQHLACCLTAIRGGSARAELIESDMVLWMKQYGPITRESVDRWAEQSDELKFGLDLIISRAVRE